MAKKKKRSLQTQLETNEEEEEEPIKLEDKKPAALPSPPVAQLESPQETLPIKTTFTRVKRTNRDRPAPVGRICIKLNKRHEFSLLDDPSRQWMKWATTPQWQEDSPAIRLQFWLKAEMSKFPSPTTKACKLLISSSKSPLAPPHSRRSQACKLSM